MSSADSMFEDLAAKLNAAQRRRALRLNEPSVSKGATAEEMGITPPAPGTPQLDASPWAAQIKNDWCIRCRQQGTISAIYTGKNLYCTCTACGTPQGWQTPLRPAP